MLSNTKILQHVKHALETFDKMKPEDPKLHEMENKNIQQSIIDILMTPEIQKHILPNEDIFSRYEEALATSGRSAKSVILKRHPKIEI